MKSRELEKKRSLAFLQWLQMAWMCENTRSRLPFPSSSANNCNSLFLNNKKSNNA